MRLPRAIPLVLVIAGSAFLAGCELKDDGDNLANGKQQFVQKCGACHILERAGTTGVAGPNLDEAFERARLDGMKDSTFAGVILKQIEQPNRRPQLDPLTMKPAGSMPANIVTGDDAQDVAAYVGMVAGAGGEDTGRLAAIGVKKAEGTAEAENGVLEIPADPGGGLAYTFADAKAPAGSVTFRSPNESSVPHNIAVEGNGVNEEGEVVTNGGVSEITADLQPGEYEFFCSVPGHREGGMAGKLTIE